METSPRMYAILYKCSIDWPFFAKCADELKAHINSRKALFLYLSCDILGLPKSDILSIIFL